MTEREDATPSVLIELEGRAMAGLAVVRRVLGVLLSRPGAAQLPGTGALLAESRRSWTVSAAMHDSVFALLNDRRIGAENLRLAAALLHLARRVEEMGEECVAELFGVLRRNPPVPEPASLVIGDIAELTRRQVECAEQAFRARNLPLAEELRRRHAEIVSLGHSVLELAVVRDDLVGRVELVPAVLASESLVRISERALEIGEEVVFLVSGLFREVADRESPLSAR